jgi:hypothetical protein
VLVLLLLEHVQAQPRTALAEAPVAGAPVKTPRPTGPLR